MKHRISKTVTRRKVERNVTAALTKALKQGVTQSEIAEASGLSCPSIGRYLNHNSVPDAVAAVHLAVALGVTVDYLLLGDRERKP